MNDQDRIGNGTPQGEYLLEDFSLAHMLMGSEASPWGLSMTTKMACFFLQVLLRIL
jgi:hypothetical protein